MDTRSSSTQGDNELNDLAQDAGARKNLPELGVNNGSAATWASPGRNLLDNSVAATSGPPQEIPGTGVKTDAGAVAVNAGRHYAIPRLRKHVDAEAADGLRHVGHVPRNAGPQQGQVGRRLHGFGDVVVNAGALVAIVVMSGLLIYISDTNKAILAPNLWLIPALTVATLTLGVMALVRSIQSVFTQYLRWSGEGDARESAKKVFPSTTGVGLAWTMVFVALALIRPLFVASGQAFTTTTTLTQVVANGEETPVAGLTVQFKPGARSALDPANLVYSVTAAQAVVNMARRLRYHDVAGSEDVCVTHSNSSTCLQDLQGDLYWAKQPGAQSVAGHVYIPAKAAPVCSHNKTALYGAPVVQVNFTCSEMDNIPQYYGSIPNLTRINDATPCRNGGVPATEMQQHVFNPNGNVTTSVAVKFADTRTKAVVCNSTYGLGTASVVTWTSNGTYCLVDHVQGFVFERLWKGPGRNGVGEAERLGDPTSLNYLNLPLINAYAHMLRLYSAEYVSGRVATACIGMIHAMATGIRATNIGCDSTVFANDETNAPRMVTYSATDEYQVVALPADVAWAWFVTCCVIALTNTVLVFVEWKTGATDWFWM